MKGLTRRHFGAGVIGASVLGASPLVGKAARAQSEMTKRDRLNTMIRMMGRTDGGIAIRWTKGVLSAIIDKETMPLLGVSQQIYTRHRLNEDGSFDAVYFEIVYFTDLKTGIAEETWNNPITGRAVTVPAQVLGPTRVQVSLDLKMINEPFPMEGLVNNHWLEPESIEAGEMIFEERIDSYVPPMTDGGQPLKFHEVFTFRTPLENLSGSAPHVPTTVYKLNVISWRPWMEMDDVDGVTMSRGTGRVIADYQNLPADLVEKNQKHFPDVIEEIEDYVSL
ncbi:MAG: DUF1838 family protein [Rhodospirillaceae bacterium]